MRQNKFVNLASLTCIQVSNGVLPILIFPFTLAVIGPDLYAKVVLSEGLAIVLLAMVLYSFEIDGVALVVGMNPLNERHRVSRAFSTIFYLRIAIFLVGAPIVLLVAALLDDQMLPLAFWWLLVPLSYALQPNWLFQGLEHNSPVATVTVLSRAAAVALVLSFVNNPRDHTLVPVLIGLAYLAGAIGSLIYARCRFGIRLVAVPLDALKRTLWSGKEIFLGSMSVLLYRDINVVLLGVLMAPGSSVATYSMAEKITKAIQASTRPLNQLFMPNALRIAGLAGRPSPTVLAQLLRITWPQLAALAPLLAILAVGYTTLGSEIQGIENVDAIASLVALMSLVPLLGVPNFMLGWAGLSVLDSRRYLLGALLATGLLNLMLCVPLISLYGEDGAAVCFVLAEAFLLYLVVRRYIT